MQYSPSPEAQKYRIRPPRSWWVRGHLNLRAIPNQFIRSFAVDDRLGTMGTNISLVQTLMAALQFDGLTAGERAFAHLRDAAVYCTISCSPVFRTKDVTQAIETVLTQFFEDGSLPVLPWFSGSSAREKLAGSWPERRQITELLHQYGIYITPEIAEGADELPGWVRLRDLLYEQILSLESSSALTSEDRGRFKAALDHDLLSHFEEAYRADGAPRAAPNRLLPTLSFLNHVVLLSEEMIRPAFTHLPPLEAMYVPLLAAVLQPEATQRPKNRPQVAPAEDLIRAWLRRGDDPAHQLALLTGEPGAGKSSTTRKVACDIAAQMAQCGHFPTIVRIPALKLAPRITTGDHILGAIMETLDHLAPRGGSHESIVVFLDGIDELQSERRLSMKDLGSGLSGATAWPRGMRLLISGREPQIASLSKHTGTAYFRLLSLCIPPAQRRIYRAATDSILMQDLRLDWVRSYSIATHRDAKRIKNLVGDEAYDDLTSQPLLLAITAMALEATTLSSPPSRSRLYWKAMECIFERVYEGGLRVAAPQVLGFDEFHQVFEEVAILAMRSDGYRVSRGSLYDHFESRDLIALLDRVIKGYRESDGYLNLVCSMLMRQTSLPSSSDTGAFEFTHPTFAEYLVASSIMRSARECLRHGPSPAADVEPPTASVHTAPRDTEAILKCWSHLHFHTTDEMFRFLREQIDHLPEDLLKLELSDAKQTQWIAELGRQCYEMLYLFNVEGERRLRTETLVAALFVLTRTSRVLRKRCGRAPLRTPVTEATAGRTFGGCGALRKLLLELELGSAKELHLRSEAMTSLAGIVYHRADLTGLRLEAANLTDSDFSGSDFSLSYLGPMRGSNRPGSRLVSGLFRECDFFASNLYAADLRGADLSGCRFTRVDLRAARFRGGNFAGTKFEGASFVDCTMDDELGVYVRSNGASVS